MNSNTGFILKILVASFAISAAIKYAGPSLPIPATNASAAIAVFLPSLVMAILLLGRGRQQKGEADT